MPSTAITSCISARAIRAAGQPISQLMQRALAEPELISLAAGFVDPVTLPCEAVRIATEALLAERGSAREALQYGTPQGNLLLREAILGEALAADDGAGVSGEGAGSIAGIGVERVVITAGSNQLLSLLSEAILDPGDMVLCGSPTYFVYTGLLAQLGAVPIGVAVDSLGLVPESIDEHLADCHRRGELSKVKAVYVVSYFDNPCSVTLSAERRRAILEIVERWSRDGGQRIHIIEDAAYRELRYEGEDVASLLSLDAGGQTVVQAGTFSKSFSPGVRIGWGILPPDLVRPVCDLKSNLDFGTSHFDQRVMAKVLEMGLLEPHVEQIRSGYRKKMKAMLDGLEIHLSSTPGVSWIRPRGGLYVWLSLAEEIDTGLESRLFELALRAGVIYVPGVYSYPSVGEEVKHNTMRLSFGVKTAQEITAGIGALAGAIGEL